MATPQYTPKNSIKLFDTATRGTGQYAGSTVDVEYYGSRGVLTVTASAIAGALTVVLQASWDGTAWYDTCRVGTASEPAVIGDFVYGARSVTFDQMIPPYIRGFSEVYGGNSTFFAYFYTDTKVDVD